MGMGDGWVMGQVMGWVTGISDRQVMRGKKLDDNVRGGGEWYAN